MLLWVGISYVYSVVISSAMSRMQVLVASKMINLSASDHDEYPSGIVNAVFSSDIARMDSTWVSASFGFLLSAPELVLAIGYAIYVAPPVGVLAMTVFPFIFTTVPQARAATAGRATAKAQAKTIAVFQNGMACQRMVWSCDGQAQWLNDFFRPAVEVQHASQFTSRGLGSIVNAHTVQLINLFVALHVAILACLAACGVITVGDLTGMVSLFTSLSSPAGKIGTFMRQAADCAGSAQRLDSFITEAESDYGTGLGRFGGFEADVGNSLELSEVSFTYADAVAPSISSSSLMIPPGTFAAIVGGSGCGKSTLLSLIMTWRQPSAGVLSWGPNIRLQTKASDSEAVARRLRNNMAVVFQEMMILDGSVHDNIAFGVSPSPSREDVEWAAAAAGCTEFVSSVLVEGYDSLLGSGGAALSGGQAQRICIARALCRKPNLLLMDEATSALDPHTTEEVLRTISGLRQNYPEQFRGLITILITHNPDTLKHADLVIEMAAGAIASCKWQRDRPGDTH
jgi:ABC-type multidrug transport system fused ATPase/permease subunit